MMALFAKADLLQEMPPWMGGGDMIRSVTFERTIYAPAPAKFEAGTPDIAGAIVDRLVASTAASAGPHCAAIAFISRSSVITTPS